MHMRRAGVEAHALGDPMSFWRSMPVGMHLRSNWSATNIGEPQGPLTLDRYIAETGDEFGSPVPLDKFVSYGEWFQSRAVPDLDRRRVARLESGAGGFELLLDDGEQLSARRVVVAAGIEQFPWRPPGFDDAAREPRLAHRRAHRHGALRGPARGDHRRRPECVRVRRAGGRGRRAGRGLHPPLRGHLAQGELAQEPARPDRPRRLRADRRGAALVQPPRGDAQPVPPPAAAGADADRLPLDPAGVLELRPRAARRRAPAHGRQGRDRRPRRRHAAAERRRRGLARVRPRDARDRLQARRRALPVPRTGAWWRGSSGHPATRSSPAAWSPRCPACTSSARPRRGASAPPCGSCRQLVLRPVGRERDRRRLATGSGGDGMSSPGGALLLGADYRALGVVGASDAAASRLGAQGAGRAHRDDVALRRALAGLAAGRGGAHRVPVRARPRAGPRRLGARAVGRRDRRAGRTAPRPARPALHAHDAGLGRRRVGLRQAAHPRAGRSHRRRRAAHRVPAHAGRGGGARDRLPGRAQARGQGVVQPAHGRQGMRADDPRELAAKFEEACALVDPATLIVQESSPAGATRSSRSRRCAATASRWPG